MNFENFQKSWQLQQAPAPTGSTHNEEAVQDITIRVKALQRKIIRTNVLMSLVICLTIAAFVFVLRPILSPNTIWYDTGIGITFFAALFLAVVQWLKSVAWRRQQVDLSSREFVEQAANRFRSLVRMNRKLTPFLMVFILIGINLIYLDIFWHESAKLRLTMHIGLNAFMISVGGASLFYSKKHKEASYEPVIAELEEIRQKLEEV